MIGVGFVGAGMVGQLAHLANFVELPGCRVVGLAELRPELGREAAARFGVPRLYPSHRQLFDDPEVDAVVVVTRRPATGAIVRDALRAGKHVLSEKPMAHTRAQAEELVRAAADARVVYSVGFMKRHDAGVARAKALLSELVATGELGRIILMRAYCYTGDFPCGAQGFVMTEEVRPEGLELWPVAPDWIPKKLHADYAWFLNVFVHDLNLIRFLGGRTPAVTAADLRRPNGRLVMFDFGDFPCVLEMGEVAFHEWQEGVEVVFEKGRMRLQLPPPLLKNVPARLELEHAGERKETIRFEVPWSWAFRRQAEAFIADIAGGREPLASGRDGIEDLALAEDIWRRHLSGTSAS